MTPWPGLPNRRWVKQQHVKSGVSGWSYRHTAHLLECFPESFQTLDAIQCFDFVVYLPVASLVGSVKTSLNNQSNRALFRVNDLVSLFFDFILIDNR